MTQRDWADVGLSVLQVVMVVIAWIAWWLLGSSQIILLAVIGVTIAGVIGATTTMLSWIRRLIAARNELAAIPPEIIHKIRQEMRAAGLL